MKDIKDLRWFDKEQTTLVGTGTREDGSELTELFYASADHPIEALQQVYAKALNGDYGAIGDYVNTDTRTQEEKRATVLPLSASEIRVNLFTMFSITSAQTTGIIDAIPDPAQKEVIWLLWEYGDNFERMDERIIQFGSMLGLDADKLDRLWGIE